MSLQEFLPVQRGLLIVHGTVEKSGRCSRTLKVHCQIRLMMLWCTVWGISSQMVEHLPSMQEVLGSKPIFSNLLIQVFFFSPFFDCNLYVSEK